MDHAEQVLYNRLDEIKTNCPGFSGAVFDQVSQAISSSFTTVKQFFSDTPMRAQAIIPIGWNDNEAYANEMVNVGARVVDNSWPPLFPDILSPQQSDLQSTNETSTEEYVKLSGEQSANVYRTTSNQATAVGGQAVKDMSSNRHESLSNNASSPSEVPSPSEASSPNEAPSMSDTSSLLDSPSANDTPSPIDASSNEVSTLIASTPASTPPSAYRVSFEPAHSSGDALQTTINDQETETGRINKGTTPESNDSNDASAIRQNHSSPYPEALQQSSEPLEIGGIEAHQSYVRRQMQGESVNLHHTACTNDAYSAYSCTMDASSEDQSEPDYDESDGASSARSIRGHRSNELSCGCRRAYGRPLKVEAERERPRPQREAGETKL